MNTCLFYLPLLDLCPVWLIVFLCTDMPIFGQCPAQDDFYLVMCSHCGQVVKPQAFQAHYGKCHARTEIYINIFSCGSCGVRLNTHILLVIWYKEGFKLLVHIKSTAVVLNTVRLLVIFRTP